jgi:hypothetical protein
MKPNAGNNASIDSATIAISVAINIVNSLEDIRGEIMAVDKRCVSGEYYGEKCG